MLTLPVSLVIWIGAGFLSQRCPNSDEGKIAMAIIPLGVQGFNWGAKHVVQMFLTFPLNRTPAFQSNEHGLGFGVFMWFGAVSADCAVFLPNTCAFSQS